MAFTVLAFVGERNASIIVCGHCLFALVSRNALPATAYFGIPANRVVELGMQIEL